ncbi:GntR family transcriptional regulator [Allopusillimonas ginsengisoli]|uniref:GntR family transcriptional regulator n=1 Tax=Allopusillimonas ginsengisoli TaxID=453575 RepID=UPI0039C0998D
MLTKTISKTDPVPLYSQLARLIEDEISCGKLAPGDALPTERELCEAYEVSRVTVREAIAVLKRKELVETRRGSGNYVTKHETVNRDLLGVHNFDLQIEASGHTNQLNLLEFEEDAQSRYVAEVLGVPADTSFIKVVRLRSADDIPLFIETIYLSRSRFSGLVADDFLSTKLFSKKLLEEYKTEISEITLMLDPVLLRENEAAVLHVSELPAAGLLNERISFDTHNNPVVFSQWLFSRHRCRHLLKIKAK